MTEPGVIRNRQHAQQIKDFSGLRFGKISPTDIDAFLDFSNRLFVFVEGKHGSSMPPYGQRLALERLCDACHNPPFRYAVTFLVSHVSDGDVDYAKTVITAYRWNGKWRTPKCRDSNLIDGINTFRAFTSSTNVIPFKPK